MKWNDLATKVIGLGAPVLGGALGGPAGAMAGKVLADMLGVPPTPDAVGAAIDADPAAAVAVSDAEAEWARTQAIIGAAQVREVALTQRAEMESGDVLQRWWRPVYALELSLVESPLFLATLMHALWTGHETGINGFANLSGLLMTYFGARFGVLGVYVSGRTREKQTCTTGEAAPGWVGELAKALRKR